MAARRLACGRAEFVGRPSRDDARLQPQRPGLRDVGRKQQMTWAFFDKYCDEAYAIVDDKDSAKSKLDVQKLVDALNSLK